MSKTPLFSLSPEANPNISLILTIALSGSAVVLGCIGYIGLQEGWWDEIIAYVFYFTAVMDAMLGIVLPRFIAGQTANIKYSFYDDRLEISDDKSLFFTLSYAHVISVSEHKSDKQKAAGRTSIKIEVDKAALSSNTGRVSKTLNIVNVSNSTSPAAQIRDVLESYERENL